MPEEEISKERIIKTGRMLENTENIAVVVFIAFLVMQCVYTVKDGINTHNDYKNSVLVEAEVLEVFGYEKDEVVVKYRYDVDGKAYEAAAIRGNKSIKPGNKETIRVGKDGKKIFKYNSEPEGIWNDIMTDLGFVNVFGLVIGLMLVQNLEEKIDEGRRARAKIEDSEG